ncbi:MAG: SGNH/GDSL hydrolase family protein, partial [Candidatus Omnitrophica bacterium]|nr:SGNH/GDSL hydrolase family protein [Candidatus Omnitrophota bacterium]
QEKGKDEKAIICLGDSITFGYGVANNETFPYFLSQALNKGNLRNKFKVVNLGVVAYNTYQERLYLQRYGINFTPDIIIVGICLNDIGGQLMFPSGITDKFFEPFYSGSKSRLYRYEDMPLVCKAQILALRNSYLAQYIFLRFEKLAKQMKWFYTPMKGDYAQLSLDYYAGRMGDELKKRQSIFEEEALLIKEIADKHKAKLLFMLFPNDIQLSRQDLRVPQEVIGNFCRKNSIYCLDLLPELKKYKKEEILLDIGHPSPFGNKVVSDLITGFMEKNNLIGG